jgi:magnesium chelatase family protein
VRPVFASVATFALEGVESHEVTVEVDLRRGLPAFTVVGLPDAGVREARERVRAALLNSRLEFPLKRVTANLAPAHLRKAGPSFDLALALAVLAASDQVPREGIDAFAVCGELSLGGGLRPVLGTLAMALGARRAGYPKLIVPVENASEAALVDGLEVLAVPSLERLVDLLWGRWAPSVAEVPRRLRPAREDPDLSDVRGQSDARRALEIAAAGGHSLLMTGLPGVGKTMLARRLPGILPPPAFEEAVEITQVHSVAGLSDGALAEQRPFRAPHHTISPSGLVGGGSSPRPGEISLAHRGVLFLDEVAEFSRAALEALREPLEAGRVEVMRGQRMVVFPAEVMLVAACNPCPCGRRGSECGCTEADRARYARRLSGPLLDRIDLVCQLAPPAPMEAGARGESSASVRARVVHARERQRARLEGTSARCNAGMDARLSRTRIHLDTRARARLVRTAGHGTIGGRSYDRVLRVARTVADLAGRDRVEADDVDEAVGFRLGPSARAVA